MSKSKRKLLISMLVAMFVLLSAIAIVAIAFALTQQTITTTLNIGYTVTDLDGSVYATYTVGGTKTYLNPNPASDKNVSTDGHSLVFNAEDTTAAGKLDFPNDIALTSTNDNIVIQYTYANTGGKHYIASMSFASNIVTDNMTVEYSKDGENYSTDRYAVVVPSGATEKSYWIKISITNKAKSASFSGDFQWDLVGCNQDQASADYLSLTSLEFSGSNGSYSASISSTGDYTGTIVFPSKVGTDSVTTISASETITDEEKLKIKGVVIPDSVTAIGNNAFKGYRNLQTVTFEQNVVTSSVKTQSSTGLQTIGDFAFYGIAITDIQIPNTVTSLGNSCIKTCGNLTSIKIPSSVTNVPSSAFAYCASVESITVDSNNSVYTSSNNCLLKGTELVIGCKNSVIPSNVTSIATCAFEGCTGLTSVTIPTGVTSIGSYSFASCKGLTTLTVPSSVKTIGQYAFRGCTGLTELNLPTGLTSFDMTAYSNCTSLTSIMIPQCVIDANKDVGDLVMTSENLTHLEPEGSVCRIRIVAQKYDNEGNKDETVQWFDMLADDADAQLQSLRNLISSYTSSGYTIDHVVFLNY